MLGSKIDPLHTDERNDDLVDATPEQREQHQRNQYRGNRQLDIDDAHDQRIDATPDIAGKQAEQRSDCEGKTGADGRDDQTDAQAIDDGAQHIASLIIGTEDIQSAVKPSRQRRQPAIEKF
jgi:hypothetical protein